MPRFHVQSAFLITSLLVALIFGGCSCDSHRTTDAAIDAAVLDSAVGDGAVADAAIDAASDATIPDASVDGGGVTVGILIHRNVAGGSSARSSNYRLVRTHGRSVGGSSMSVTHRDGVHGGGQP